MFVLAIGTSILRIQILLMISVSSTRSGASTSQVFFKHLNLALVMHIITSTLLACGCVFQSLSQCIWKYHLRYVSSLTPPTRKYYSATSKYTSVQLLLKYSVYSSCIEQFSIHLLNVQGYHFIISNILFITSELQ